MDEFLSIFNVVREYCANHNVKNGTFFLTSHCVDIMSSLDYGFSDQQDQIFFQFSTTNCKPLCR